MPNYITSKTIEAPIVMVDGIADPDLFDGNVAVIEGADPGFDWLFSTNIVGLITKYGGVNSHMAIRCGEFHCRQQLDVVRKSSLICSLQQW